jgi:phage shock protein C
MNRRLFRSPDDRVLAGVAGGMAEAYDLDPALVRVGWALLILVTGGVFLLLYIVMALVVPLRPAGVAWAAAMAGGPTGPLGPDGAPAPTSADAPPPAGPPSGSPYWSYRHGRHHDGNGALVVGLILIVAGAYFLARQYIPAFNWSLVWPLIAIVGGLLLILIAVGRGRSAA